MATSNLKLAPLADELKDYASCVALACALLYASPANRRQDNRPNCLSEELSLCPLRPAGHRLVQALVL